MNSEIILCSDINVDKNYINVLNYTEEQMVALCRSKAITTSTDYSFIRTNGFLSTGFTYNQCLQANYIAFRNPDYSGKWFFAFIDEVIYKGNYNTQLRFTIDAWSTWFSYWTQKPCYVIRHHVNNDTIGLHTVPENLDVVDVEQESYEEFMSFENNENAYYFCINTTYNPVDEEDLNGVTKVNGNLQGNYIFCFDVYDDDIGVSNVTNFISKTNKDGKIDAIKELYILPKVLVDAIGTTAKNYSAVLGSFNSKLLNSNDIAIPIAQSFTKTHSFQNISIKNNKCFVYPYNYLLISNNCGNNNIYKYENFSQNNPIFTIEMAVSIGGSIRLVPREYKKIDYNYEECLPLAKFPTCSWSSDSFTNWLTQNAVNVTTQIVGTGVALATENYMAVAGGIANLIGQFRSATLAPDITGGNNSGDVNFCIRKNTFSVYHMRAKEEYLKIIDDYFTRFGYKILRVTTPNITGRQYWNYIEIGQNEDIGYSSSNAGSVPSQYMEIINNACRKGVTIWHNHANIGNFSLNNSIV